MSFAAEALRRSPGCALERLDLSDCEAGDGAAVALASALMEANQQGGASTPGEGGRAGAEEESSCPRGAPSRSGSRSRSCGGAPGVQEGLDVPSHSTRRGPLTHLDLSSNQLTIKGSLIIHPPQAMA